MYEKAFLKVHQKQNSTAKMTSTTTAFATGAKVYLVGGGGGGGGGVEGGEVDRPRFHSNVDNK